MIRDDGTQSVLPARYVDAGHVAHGYATTGHKAQGMTVDHTFVLGSDRLYREWGYVALSRGRHTDRLYLHPSLADPNGIAYGRQPQPDPHAETLAGLRRSAAHTPAVAYLQPADTDVTAVATRWRQLADLLDDHRHRRVGLTSQHDTLTRQRDHIDQRIAGLEHQRAQPPGGLGRVRRSVRDQASRLDDEPDRARRDRHSVHLQLAEVDRRLHQLTPHNDLQPLRDEQAHLGGQLLAIVQARTAAAVADPPGYLLATIGTRPDGQAGPAWHRAARAVEEYRTLWHVTDPHRSLGDPPHHPTAGEQRQRAVRALLDAAPQRELERQREPGPEREREPVRSLQHGISR